MKLRCENLVKKYGIRTVVKGVSMEINQGEIVGFLGPNGAGKTTSFYMITGQIVPNGGKVFLDDEDITSLPMYMRAKKGIGYLPQEASVFRKMSVENNILSVMEMSPMTKEERMERLESLIDEFNLSKVRKSLGIQLSGGERRRCEIARALAIDPKFILLDEPFAGVDPIAVEDIQYIIAKLKYRNIGVIITDHNVGETLAITDRAYLLYEGTILQQGTPEALAADDDVRTKYLGSGFILKKAVAVERAKAEHEAALAAAASADAALESTLSTATEILSAYRGRRVAIMNEALVYCAMDYGLETAATIERESGDGMSGEALQSCLEKLSQSEIDVVLIERQAPQALVEAIRAAGFAVAKLDVLSTHTEGEGFEDYLEIQLDNARAMADAFERAAAGKDTH